MICPYVHQAEAANLIGAGDYILFSDMKGGGVNSGTVGSVNRDEGRIVIEDINGEGESIEFELNKLFFYYDTKWRE